MPTVAQAPIPPARDFDLHTWFERDRAHVELRHSTTETTVVEWRDDAVGEAIQDGYLDSKAFVMGRLLHPERLKASVYQYAVDHGMLNKLAATLEKQRLKDERAAEAAERRAIPQPRRRGRFHYK